MVNIVDPHIKTDASYRVYKEAEEKGLFVKNKDGTSFKGCVSEGAREEERLRVLGAGQRVDAMWVLEGVSSLDPRNQALAWYHRLHLHHT